METCSTLAGCLLQHASAIPGNAKLVAVPSIDTLRDLICIPGVRYASSQSIQGWYVPYGIVLQGHMPAELRDWVVPEWIGTATPAGLQLDVYQMRSSAFLARGGPGGEGAILAAAPGLGKTICALQALRSLSLLDEPGLVCGPKKSMGAWIGEDKDPARYYGIHIEPLHGEKSDRSIISRNRHVFCHYEILKNWWRELFSAGLKWIVFDEIHLLSNPSAKQTMAAIDLSMSGTVTKRMGLTGTPIENSRLDLWSQLKIVQPRQWGTYHQSFGIRYCDGRRGAERDGGHWSYEGETNTEELAYRLAGTILRYEPDDIPAREITFPTAHRRVVKIEGIPKSWWDEYNGILINTVKTTTGPAQLMSLTRELGVLSALKAPYAAREVVSMLVRHDHIVVLASRKGPAATVHSMLKDMFSSVDHVAHRTPQVFGPATGDMDHDEREALADEFAACPCGVYVATLGAVGMSINNLDCASALLHADLWWTASKIVQGDRRVLRRSNKHKSIEVVYLHVPNTADDKIVDFILKKSLATSVIGSSSTEGTKLASTLGVCAPKELSLSELICRSKEIARELGYNG